MITFDKKERQILLVYEPDSADPNWVTAVFDRGEEVALRSETFYFRSSDLQDTEESDDEGLGGSYKFIFAELGTDDYFKIEGRKLGIGVDVYLHKDIKVSDKMFSVPHHISVFKKIAHVVNADIYIGGDNDNAIPQNDFSNLMKNFPSSYELSKYSDARLGIVLNDYFSSASKAKEKYLQYMNKKPSQTGDNLSENFKDIELLKYRLTLEKLEEMLEQSESYSEHQWQKEILDIILLLLPKYVYVFENARVKDDYQNKVRKLDLLLVDANGHIDVIEIKKPFGDAIMSSSKYRDNYVPKRELSGSIVQLEKYILYLSKSGVEGEKYSGRGKLDTFP